MRRSLLAVTVLVATAGLGGCAASEAEQATPEPKVLKGSAKGAAVKGTGYTFKAPKGWSVKKVRIPGYGFADKHVIDTGDRDGFADNVSVIIAPPDAYDVDRMEASALNEMGTVGATNRRVRQPVLVAGESTTHVSARMVKDRVHYVVEQYHPVHDDQVYVVTFSFSPGLGRAARDKTAAAVLNTWKWRT